jgi:anaerobic magnesium-protoporphyrin IX monomethyl ester cyclase
MLVNPPETTGHISFRDMAGGLGTSPRASLLRTIFFDMNLEQHPGPPMDLLYSAAVLEHGGFKLQVLDSIGLKLGPEKTLSSIISKGYNTVGIRISLPSLMSDVKLINDVKRARPDALVFGFGPAIKTTFQHWIDVFKGDFLIFGEPEAVIARALSGDYRTCEGILYKQPNGAYKATSAWVYCDDLDALPYPAWHLFPLRSYAFKRQVSNFTFYVLSSRGCPNSCNMCPYPVHHGRKWRSRTPESVADEMAYLKKRFGTVNVQFRDPNFGLNKNRLRRICELLKASGYSWRWSCEVDLQNLDEELVELMSGAGCVKIMTGVESIDNNALGDIGQDPRVIPRIGKMVDFCKSKNIDLTGFYIVGFPSDTWDSVSKTLDYARKMYMRSVVSLMTPYHGTELREESLRDKLVDESAGFECYDGFNCVMRTKAMDFGEVELAWKYVQSELDYINHELTFNKYHDLRKLGALMKMAENRIKYIQVRSMARSKIEQARS